MQRKTKMNLIAFLSLALVGTAAGGACIGVSAASAENVYSKPTGTNNATITQEIADSPLTSFQLFGASIRKNEPAGIRFLTTISNADAAKFPEGAEFGTFIIPKTLLGENELTEETANVLPAIAQVNTFHEKVPAESMGYFITLAGDTIETAFPAELYGTVFAARSFVKYTYTPDGETEAVTDYAYTSETIYRSISYVASAELVALENRGEPDTDRSSFLNSIIAATTTEMELTLSATEANAGDSITATVTGATDGVNAYEYILSSDNEDVVKVENGALTAVGSGKATVTAKIGVKEVSKTLEVKIPVYAATYYGTLKTVNVETSEANGETVTINVYQNGALKQKNMSATVTGGVASVDVSVYPLTGSAQVEIVAGADKASAVTFETKEVMDMGVELYKVSNGKANGVYSATSVTGALTARYSHAASDRTLDKDGIFTPKSMGRTAGVLFWLDYQNIASNLVSITQEIQVYKHCNHGGPDGIFYTGAADNNGNAFAGLDGWSPLGLLSYKTVMSAGLKDQTSINYEHYLGCSETDKCGQEYIDIGLTTAIMSYAASEESIIAETTETVAMYEAELPYGALRTVEAESTSASVKVDVYQNGTAVASGLVANVENGVARIDVSEYNLTGSAQVIVREGSTSNVRFITNDVIDVGKYLYNTSGYGYNGGWSVSSTLNASRIDEAGRIYANSGLPNPSVNIDWTKFGAALQSFTMDVSWHKMCNCGNAEGVFGIIAGLSNKTVFWWDGINFNQSGSATCTYTAAELASATATNGYFQCYLGCLENTAEHLAGEYMDFGNLTAVLSYSGTYMEVGV